MPNQILQKAIPNSILFDFLEKYAIKYKKYFLITKETFKRAKFNNDIDIFYKKIMEYYQRCKRFYISRKQSYKRLITIIRQICKHNHLAFTSKIQYNNSNYEIQYYVFIPQA